jgi:hypothetical protein
MEKMTLGRWTWADVQAKLPAFEGKEEEPKAE